LSKKIANTYGAENTVICAGDDYFTDKTTGKYVFDGNKLADAHASAKLKAEQACAYVYFVNYLNTMFLLC